MSDDGFVLTRRGFEEMRRELDEILTVKRPSVIERIRDARQTGELAESSDYDDAKRLQSMLEARMIELRAILSHAQILEEAAHDGTIGIGSAVTVDDVEGGYTDEFVIVGPAESSPGDGRISHESCVGSALMGRKVGDTVSIRAPGGTIKYKIVSIQ